MTVNGREVKFFYNVLASLEVAKLCPEGQLENIGKLFENTSYEEDVTLTNKFMIALNRGYNAVQKAVNPDYEAKELTEEELLILSNAEYVALQDEAMEAYNAGNKRNVHTEPIQTKGKKTGKAVKK